MWNQGGRSGYGASSMAGGGYTQSPGGFASSRGGEKKGRQRTTHIIPCTVSQLMSAAQTDEVFRVGEVELTQVTIVGVIRSIDKTVTNIQYKVDDMTCAPMDVKHWVDTEDPSGDSAVLPPGTYVKVTGNLRTFQNVRSVVAFSVRPLENMNAITSHMLEVVEAHKPQNTLSGGGGVMNSSSISMSRPGNNSTTGGYSGASDTANDGLNPNQNQVLSLIMGCQKAEGISLQELKQRLGGMSMPVIRQAVEFLSNEGHIFSTIDEDHYKSTDSGDY